MMTEALPQRISEIQQSLRDARLDGWLFYDFRYSDPLAYRILQLDPTLHVTRRWYYWIPAQGAPVKLLHRIEPHVLDTLPGQTDCYVSGEQAPEDLPLLFPRHITVGLSRQGIQYVRLDAMQQFDGSSL